jgi:hypothetical protein
MSHEKDDIIMFVEEHFDNTIDKNTYKFVKELYEYISFLYEGDVSESDLTSESDSEEPDDSVKETFTYCVDQTGFYSLT